MNEGVNQRGCVLFDWGDTLMRDFPELTGPMATWPSIETCAHAPEALAALRSKGWLIALATNAADSSESEIWDALRRAGLDRLLDRVYCFGNVGHRKPSPRFFDFVVHDLGLPRSAVVMVGDDFDIDVAGANAAGVRAIWLAPGSAPDRVGEMHCTIRDLADLPSVLGQWTNAGTDRTSAST